MATLFAKTAGGNWSAAGTWSNTGAGGADSSGPPTAADDVIFELLSGNVTIDSAAVCRSLDCTSGTGSYTGTLTHNSSITLSIGDATAGAGNVALKLASGMTYTLGSATTSAISFVTTSATTQTVDFAGKTSGNVTFNATSNGNWQFTGTHVMGSSATFTLTKGTLDINGQTCTWGLFDSNNSNTRSLTLGAASITISGNNSNAWNTGQLSGYTFSGSSSTITFTNTTASGLNNGGTGGTPKTFGTVSATSQTNFQLQGGTFGSLSVTGNAVGNAVLNILNLNITVTGTLTLTGNNAATYRLWVISGTTGTARTITNSGATMNWSNVDFRDITLGTAYDASGITGKSGDLGGNTNITFTTSQNNYWVGNSGNWNNVSFWASSSGGSAGSGRVPLPQDDCIFDANSITISGRTITANQAKLGRNINFSAVANSPTWTVSASGGVVIYGSLTLASGMTLNNTVNISFGGRSGSYTLTSAGKTFGQTVGIACRGGTVTLQDAFSGSDMDLSAGTFDANDFNVTLSTAMSINGTITRTLNMGTGTWTLSRTSGTVWSLNNTGITLNEETSTIAITNTGASSKTFGGGGQTYYNLTISGGGAGQIIHTGANTFNVHTINAPKTVHFTASTTTTFQANPVWTGSAGNVITIASATAATHTLSRSTGTISCDYLHLTNSIATGGASWYAGANSTDVSGNSGWIFTAPPAVSTGEEYIIISTG